MNENIFKAKILDLGRVTIPQEIREKYSFKKGDIIILQVIGKVQEEIKEIYFAGDRLHDGRDRD